ncbi:hypothetical protein MJH12_01255 [bacterium]|nr:hypothetical protein [bacterium]
MKLQLFHHNLKSICPKFYDLHQDDILGSDPSSIDLTFGTLATYFVCLLECENNVDVQEVLSFVDFCLKSEDSDLVNGVLNTFLLAIYDLEFLNIIDKGSLFKVLNEQQKSLLVKHITKRDQVSLLTQVL